MIGPLELIARRDFENKESRAYLDGLSVPEIIVLAGSPTYVLHYRKPLKPHDTVPALASDDPAVTEAMGRCAVSRIDFFGVSLPRMSADGSRIHRAADCQWCDYPTAELIAACDYAIGTMRYLEDELLVWHENEATRGGAKYIRPGRSGVYEHPGWADFWASPTHERERRIAAAMYGDQR
jgi:hypothetical protein